MIYGYFDIHPSGEIAIVSKWFWDENGFLNGDGIDMVTEQQLPKGFYALCESVYEYSGQGDPREELIAAGFEEKDLI